MLPGHMTVKGKMLTNANGDIDTSGAGYDYVISTLSEIRAEVVEQKFSKIAPADYMPVSVGQGAYMDEIIQNLTFQTGGGFFDGDIQTNQDSGRIAQVDVVQDKIRMPIQVWAKQVIWTLVDVAKAASASNWDLIASLMESLKTDWDLGIQEVAFLGHPSVSTMTGLLNDSQVNINTSLITTPITNMSETQFQNFVGGIMKAYFVNSNSTEDQPDKFVMPTSDYLGLVKATSNTYNTISKIEFLLNAFKKATRNENFEILPLAYSQADQNSDRGINKNRYVLYKSDPKTMKMEIPLDFTMLEAATANNFNWTQPAHGQYSGLLVNRKREVLYLDETAT
jgi:hypothetical protein